MLIPLIFVSAQSIENEPFTPFRYEYSPAATFDAEGNILVKGEITDIAEQALTEAEVALQHIESDENILQGQRNFQNTIKAIEAVLDKLDLTFNPFEGLKYTGIHFDFVFLF
ncbi:MAG TPA: hypothetical protein VJB34_04375 [Bdellovibrionota bacterium]|nr:hypothetical protein [Bdellovibrionota bacterium]